MCGIELMSTSKLFDVDSSTVQQNLAYWPVDDHSFIEKLRQLLWSETILCLLRTRTRANAALTQPNHTGLNMLILKTYKIQLALKYLFSDLIPSTSILPTNRWSILTSKHRVVFRSIIVEGVLVSFHSGLGKAINMSYFGGIMGCYIPMKRGESADYESNIAFLIQQT